MDNSKGIRTTVHEWLHDKRIIWTLISIFVALTVLFNSAAYFYGVLIVVVYLWSARWNWISIKLRKSNDILKLLVFSLVWTLISYIIIDLILTPITEIVFATDIDLSSFNYLKGNVANYLLFLCFMWIVAAFGEEFVYRGFIQNKLHETIGQTNISLYLSLIITSLLFGLAHQYQGISGMITTGAMGFILGWIYVKGKHALWGSILVHGLYDTLGLTLIYFDVDRYPVDFVKNLLI